MGRKYFAGPTNLWLFQHNTCNGPERCLNGKIASRRLHLRPRVGWGGHLCTQGFIHRQLDSLGTSQVTPMITQSANALMPRDMWSSLQTDAKKFQEATRENLAGYSIQGSTQALNKLYCPLDS